MRILVGQRTRPDHNLTIYDDTKFSSCHTPYINSILHHASSYYFLSHKKLFQAGNFNVNVRPELLYFSIWRLYSKSYQKHNLWPMKTAKNLCTSSRRLVYWNVIHSTKISVVLLALKAKGQKLLNAPRIILWIQSGGKIGVGFTIDTDFFDNFFDSEGNLFFFFLFCTKTPWCYVVLLW